MRAGAERLRPSRPALALALVAGALALAGVLTLAGALPGSGASGAAAQSSAAEALPQTDASVPARQVTMIGATPEEPAAPGGNETWGVGSGGRAKVLVRYTSGGGWSLGPALPAHFTPDAGQLAGQMTPRGSGVLVGTVPGAGTSTREVVLVRKVGGPFEETTPVPGEGEEPLLKTGEALFAGEGPSGPVRAPLIAPLDEAGGAAGALVVPVASAAGVESQVLHWGAGKWTSEPIAIPAASAGEFRVLGIGASSPGNAWLLGQLASGSSYPAGAVALFRRVEESGHWSWKPVKLSAGSGDGELHPLTVPLESGEPAPFTVAGVGQPPTVRAQLLTVTSEGVWIDGERADVHGAGTPSATLFFKPEGSAGGVIQTSWCALPAGASKCKHELPEALPSAYTRSFAWSGGSAYGQRVITGLPGGVSLRLEGETFKTVLSLGAGERAEDDPGAALGAAFSSPTEGWLGVAGVPVHLTTSLAPSKLTPWPAPFRHPLFAIAPQPGAPVGSLSSEALAVGERGAVARYKPGEGWLPESLFGSGGRVQTPRLRAVAWPTSTRAYAVGDEGAMWLWRGETGLWERDPATPLNFRGDLLGVAFDPGNPARGYAVGSSVVGLGGVLLRHGKSWVQEGELPAQVQGASFISIAFSGSEAIVAYREQSNAAENRNVGGLIVNDGSGWRLDPEASALAGSAVPEAVAGLPDGGAAFVTTGGPEGARVYERESAGAQWKPTPTPLPGPAGALALFREGGALRAVATGGGVGGSQTEIQPQPPGAPPNFHGPLSPSAGVESGDVLRQTAGGWSDEGHELNTVGPQPGGYQRQDLPYRPDPIFAVLVDPAGGQGWVVGGELDETEERLETADVERYPADGVAPTVAGQAVVPLRPPAPTGGGTSPSPPAGYATFAVGGHAECVAPCASRSLAGVGPQTWLASAVALASKIGVRAFLYTGPSVTEGQVSGHRSIAIPFTKEIAQTASILASGSVPPFVAAAPQDLDARPEREGTEAGFEQAFAAPFPQAGPTAGNGSAANCADTVNCQAAYYAFASTGAGGAVRVIVLDDTSGEVSDAQLGWLEGELRSAKEAREPAIALGAADIAAEMNAGDARAGELAKTLVTGSRTGSLCNERSPCDSASAYFYDAAQENVRKPLRDGGESIESFGSGTLGYVEAANEQRGDFHGASGILLAQVNVATRNGSSNRAEVITPRLIPVIGELAMEAKDGTLLRRSEAALFAGLARRPRAGCLAEASGNGAPCQIDPYIPIPSICVGECATALLPEYSFSSSRTDIGNFVEPNTASVDPRAVLQNAKGEPIPDPQSGLFCAYNAGTTIVTISAGGLSASLPVTIQAGSVRQPCGTQPLKEHLASQQQTAPAPPPPPPPTQPTPAGATPAAASPPVPLLAPPLLSPPAPAPAPPPAVIPPFVPLLALPAPLLAFLPPPIPTPARPTPPSGTSAVTSPIEAAEREEEEEEATESVSNQAVAYRPSEHEPAPGYVLGMVLLAALAGAAVRRRPRRGGRELRVAHATVSSARRQRQVTSDPRRRR